MDYNQILDWMTDNVDDHIDECDEVNATSLVEAWDNACAGGDATIQDPQHIAWDIAAIVAEKHEQEKDEQVHQSE